MAPTIQKRKYLINNIKSTILNSDNIQLNDVICPVCCSIFVEPVVLPCNHGFCLSCFNNLIKNNPLTCIICRTRFGSWLRIATKNKQLVNHRLWNLIQTKYAHFLDTKLDVNREEEDDEEIILDEGEKNKTILNTTTNTNVHTTKQYLTSLSPSTTTETKNYREIHLSPIINQLSNDRSIEENYQKEFEITSTDTTITGDRLYNNSSAKEKFTANNNNNNISDEYFEIEDDETPISSMSVSTTDSNTNKLNIITPEAITSPKLIDKKKILYKNTESNIENQMSSCQYFINNNNNNNHDNNKINDIYGNNTFSNKINLLKTFAIQINRGTEYLKQTVQNVLVTSKVTPENVMQLKPIDIHKYPNPNRNSNSRDSLNEEMYHFKPIKSYATTPKRRAATSILKVPTIKKVNNDNSFTKLAHGTCKKIIMNTKQSAFCVINNHEIITPINIKKEVDEQQDDYNTDNNIVEIQMKQQVINKNNNNTESNSTNLKRKCTNRNALKLHDKNIDSCDELLIKKVKVARGRKKKDKCLTKEIISSVVNSNSNNNDINKTIINDTTRGVTMKKTRSKCDNKFIDNNNSNNIKIIDENHDIIDNNDTDDDILIINKKTKEMQEKNDYEFAKKLQYELNNNNNSNGNTNDYLLTSTNITNNNNNIKSKRKCTLITKNYSLRNRKSINNNNNNVNNCRKGGNIININTRSNRRTVT